MLNNIKYSKAYTEVLEILNELPQDEYSKISKEKIEFYKKYKDTNYHFNYDSGKTLKEQNVSREAKAIIITIYRDYFLTQEKKEKLEKILKQNYNNNQIELRKKFNPDELFPKNEIINNSINLPVEAKKEKLYKRIIKFIKNVFNKI